MNNGIRIQQETERVKDAMNRITAYSVTDIPPELKDVRMSLLVSLIGDILSELMDIHMGILNYCPISSETSE